MLILPIVGLLAAAATLVATEMLLRWLLPYDAGSMGYRYCDNALKYGWGYAPGDPIVTRELDQGRRYYSRANNHGWRDRDRRYSNPSGSFRVLVLGDSNTFGVSIQYWMDDNLLPSFTFPNLATSIRGKPAEAIVRQWFKR